MLRGLPSGLARHPAAASAAASAPPSAPPAAPRAESGGCPPPPPPPLQACQRAVELVVAEVGGRELRKRVSLRCRSTDLRSPVVLAFRVADGRDVVPRHQVRFAGCTAPGAAPVGDDLLSNSEALAALLLGPFLFAAPPAARPAALEAFAAKVDELAQALRKGYYVQFEAAALLLCYEPPPGEAGEAAASPGASPAAADPPAASPPPPPQRASARAAHGGGSGGVPPLLVCLANVEKPGMTRAKACHAGFLAAIERFAAEVRAVARVPP